jgi:glycosyltransferase involved in cell wall biosynthesis
VWIPRLAGAKVLLNVDGEDWLREKWSGFARLYQRKCEWVSAKMAQVIISDAHAIQERYYNSYGVRSIFVPYGANIQYDSDLQALQKFGLQPDQYLLYVGRLVPENGIDLLIKAFKKVKTEKKLVIIGDAPYAEKYKQYLHEIADNRVIFTGYTFDSDYAQLSSHAYFYIQPSGIEGTRPALLDQMGFGNCVLVRNSTVNMEVVGSCGCLFDGARKFQGLTEKLQELVDFQETVIYFRKKSRSRIEQYYNWEWLTDFYEDLFMRMVLKKNLISYDEYLSTRTKVYG